MVLRVSGLKGRGRSPNRDAPAAAAERDSAASAMVERQRDATCASRAARIANGRRKDAALTASMSGSSPAPAYVQGRLFVRDCTPLPTLRPSLIVEQRSTSGPIDLKRYVRLPCSTLLKWPRLRGSQFNMGRCKCAVVYVYFCALQHDGN